MLVIDANNLAGKLNLLGKKDFDKTLVGMIEKFNSARQKKITLVFDSNDVMGDKMTEGKLTIVYTPRDNFYRDADDKIVEIIRQAQTNTQKEEVVVITDDIEIKKKAESLKCKLKGSTEFARELLDELEEQEIFDEKNEMNESVMDEVTRELLKKWK